MKYLTLPAILLLAFGCASAPDGVKDDPSYANDIQPLFNTSCAACHSGASPAAGYDLASRAGALGPGTDTIPNVVAGQPDSSELQRRLDDGTMPPSGRWDSVKVHTVRNWIARGAKDN
ncbi:hypothetical protein JXB37_00375 [candidate division WOR-3 bacterium]|nr:hypothetical protein [candidate division WOR-3 bacterium]